MVCVNCRSEALKTDIFCSSCKPNIIKKEVKEIKINYENFVHLPNFHVIANILSK